MTEPVRLAKRLAEMLACSRREAEQYIEGGWVRVNGTVVETPQFKVLDQTIELDPEASLLTSTPVTLLLHKPPGHAAIDGPRLAAQLLSPATHWAGDPSGLRPLRRHFAALECVTPLETGAGGLLIFTQEWRIKRKLQDDAALIENEVMVDIGAEVSPEALQRLNRSQVVDGRAMLAAKVSISSSKPELTTLRFAIKGSYPGRIAQMCDQVGLPIVAMKRIRIGRVGLGGVPLGQWRYLAPHERV
jgi:23S rRNA pseudouridine2604 synthase